MQSDYDNDQPSASSSTSTASGGSSNNSSSSNLLLNLPMMPLLQDVPDDGLNNHNDDAYNDLDEMHNQRNEHVNLLRRRQSLPSSPSMPIEDIPVEMPIPASTNFEQDQQMHQQRLLSLPSASPFGNNEHSIFVAPQSVNIPTSSSSSIISNPNANSINPSINTSISIPPSESSSTPSSTSSHNFLEQDHPFYNHNLSTPPSPAPPSVPLQSPEQHNIHETLHQHSPSPSFNQQASLPHQDHQFQQQEQEISQVTNDSQHEISGLSYQQTVSLSGTLPTEPDRAESKESSSSSLRSTSPYASHYSHYTHPSSQYSISHANHNHEPCYSNNSNENVLGRNKASDNNGDKMFNPNSSMSIGSYDGVGNQHYHHHRNQQTHVDRIKMLYPNVDESETPLPRCWSPLDKCLTIGLSHNNLRVQYKGSVKQRNDAASIRTAHPIPPACGLYYFEVKIISKGKNGYMGIGLTAQQFHMNRLPGWDKQSYGYHGDDGNAFSCSSSGQSYGPTFTTGDIIGCCVNFINNTCFYTKNGLDLGVAFRDLPVNTKLYPTVGLQTPGEEVDVNFGQEPFKFDQIQDLMRKMREETRASICDFPLPVEQGDPTILLHKMVSSYLVHNGYSETAEAFTRVTGQTFQEDIHSIRNRQKILRLIMSGCISQAIELTLQLYPGLLENNINLFFMLKCRQFIEMINGTDVQTDSTVDKMLTDKYLTRNQTSVIQSTKTYQNGKTPRNGIDCGNHEIITSGTDVETQTTKMTVINSDSDSEHQQNKKKSKTIKDCHYDDTIKALKNDYDSNDYINDIEMENNGVNHNGNTCENGHNYNKSIDMDEEMEIDVSPSTSIPTKPSQMIGRILEFGKELSKIGQQLEDANKLNDDDRQMLMDAFSLIAYTNPWSSPLGYQLCPTKREKVCAALNSAILELINYPKRPPLDYCVAHASELLKKMAQTSIGTCAFISVNDVFPQN